MDIQSQPEQVTQEQVLQMQRWLTAAYNHMLQSLYAMYNALSLYEPLVLASEEEQSAEAPVTGLTVIRGDKDIEG
jgi:hypothetical protein